MSSNSNNLADTNQWPIESILALHKQLLEELENRLKAYSSSTTILSDIWSKRKVFSILSYWRLSTTNQYVQDTILSLYIEYVKNFETVYSQLKYLKKKKKTTFKPIIKGFFLSFS